MLLNLCPPKARKKEYRKKGKDLKITKSAVYHVLRSVFYNLSKLLLGKKKHFSPLTMASVLHYL